MPGSSDESLLKYKPGKVRKFPRQSTCKLYHGINRKASIIAFITKRNRMKKNNKDLNFNDDVIENRTSKSEQDFSQFSMGIAENKSKASGDTLTEGNFEVSTLPLIQEYSSQYQEGDVDDHDLGQHAFQSMLSPLQATNLHRAFHTYEPEELPRVAFILPKPRQERAVYFDIDDYVYPTLQDLARLGQDARGLSIDKTLCPEMVRRTQILVADLKELRDLFERQRSRSDKSKHFIRPRTDAIHRFWIAIILIMISFYVILTSLSLGSIF